MIEGEVYIGVWQNYSLSGWMRHTLTLDRMATVFLFAALATFITLVGTRAWAIVAFTIHQIRATAQKEDGVHHQYQVVYRNSATPLGTIWYALQISWAWKKRATRNFPRLLLVVTPPILTFAAFTAASVLSPRIVAPASTASQVRLRSQDCGFLDHRAKSDAIGTIREDGEQANLRWFIDSAIRARNYARSCYDAKSQYLAACDEYVIPRLPYDTLDTAGCPFGNRCILGNDTAFLMQTPWLDSHQYFGINAAPSDRIEWRRRTTCSLLDVKDRVTKTSTAAGNIYQYHLGFSGNLRSRTNVTHVYYEHASNMMVGYTIRPGFAKDRDGAPGWIPISDLAHTDGDVSIFYFSQNGILYEDPVDDPMFSAHKQFTNVVPGSNFTYYGPDEVVHVIGCLDQGQILNPSNQLKTPFLGLNRLFDESSNIGLLPVQLNTAYRFINPATNALMFNSVNGLNSLALKAQDSLYIWLSDRLPDDQWKHEMRGWFETALAQTQDFMIAFVSKDFDKLKELSDLSITQEQRPMCESQIIRSTGRYQSFSVLVISLIACIGVFIVLLSLTLEHLVGFCQKRWGRQAYKRTLWVTDSVLHQQRLAFKHEKEKEWENEDASIPVTQLGKVWTAEPLPAVMA